MNKEEILEQFIRCQQESPQMSAAVAAIHVLMLFLKQNTAGTLAELRDNLKEAIKTLTKSDTSITSVSSGCELFLRFITLTALDHPDFQVYKQVLLDRGELFLKKISNSRQKIAKLGHPFVTDGATILVHSDSRVVLEVLKKAASANKRFTVYVTESQPDRSGLKMHNKLVEAGIPSTVILDAAMAYIMEKVDLVMVGAEGVVESGGIINKIGTYQMALCAKNANKPLYVVAESFKFVRLYPLNQQDLPDDFKYRYSTLSSNTDLGKEHPSVDYTPPSLITLLFTDLGILTPSAVSDELIKLYC
ncbi:translation initiation factor eIF-2B subunit alpha-like [Branchiostoma floridae]|uniref:Translation initiation factor eIF2B subunit alpha n=1 Tax=Branchiostoma floridae TaxID=7739 RepID=C3YD85_BRAFL|nr:translation initiation factor eIF-2B subunit alpha-like [Branchiostoma floridae]|eukprot:XP_002605686.1 hypothetical protein BRAFLDRAFT_114409 [Branchiostoma floridae]